jgi:hypothetical protein
MKTISYLISWYLERKSFYHAVDKVKVKVNVGQATKFQSGRRCWLYCFFNLGLSWGWVFKETPWPLYPQKDPDPIVQDGGWKSQPVWMGEENIIPPVIDYRDFQSVASSYTD